MQMLDIGIIGLGNVGLSVHLPILLSRNDLNIAWICDQSDKWMNLCSKKKIPFFVNLDKALEYKAPELALITTPYFSRKEIFKKIKDKVSGIYFEKPFAINLNEHFYYTKNFANSDLTIGYQRRSLGTVQAAKKIISQNIFGQLNKITIEFGDLHYNFSGFRASKEKAGGGIFLEAGSHWLDSVLFTSNAKKIENFKNKIKFNDGLDVHSEGSFNIHNSENKLITCNFKFTCLENTSNKIRFFFNNCTMDLFLFEDDSDLIINADKKDQFDIQDIGMKNFPNNSLSQGASYWNEFINSYLNKKNSYTSINEFLLTTQIIELFYEK
jgi:predicted dehydrogenase